MEITTPLSEQAHATRTGSAGRAIQILARQLDKAIKAKLADKGLTLDHFTMLMTLAEGENLTQTELGQRCRQQNYTITRALDVLVEKGLVERRADATSRRSHRVFLTKQGRALMPKLFAIVGQVNADFLQPLKPDEGATLGKLLLKLIG